jgi:alkanesulfonate monooxygenase SsuD/methylene tetrahydromethanopterin reductase-like flavin-dependent oxidoreductase (luciferase family)
VGEDVEPVTGSADQIAAALREVHEAGADEIIVVADPITENAIRVLG